MAILACVVVYLCLGSINSIDLFYSQIYIYAKQHNSEFFGDQQKLIMQLIYYVSFWIFGFCSIYQAIYCGFRVTFVLAICARFLTDLIVSLYPKAFYVQFIYPALLGFSNSSFIILPLYCCWRYYSSHSKLTVAGIVLGAKAWAFSGFKLSIFFILGVKKTQTN